MSQESFLKRLETEPLTRRGFCKKSAKLVTAAAGVTLLPEILKANPGTYNFFGSISDVLGNPREGIDVKFQNGGDVYTATTNSLGQYDIDIDTYVPIYDPEVIFDRLGVSVSWPNPTSEMAAIYVNVPKRSNISVKVCALDGTDVSDSVLIDPINGQVDRGQYLQQIDLNGFENRNADGMYIFYVIEGDKTVARKMTLLEGFGASYRGNAGSPSDNPDDWKFAKSAQGTTQSETWTMTIEDPSNNYVTHKKLINVNEGNNDLGIDTVLDNDADLIQYIDDTVRTPGYGTIRWMEKPDVYINTDNVGEETKQKILDYLTTDSGRSHNGTIANLTNGLLTYSVSEINFVSSSEMPELGDENTMLFDNTGGGSSYALRGRPDGSIKSTHVNLSNTTTNASVLHEMASCLAHVDDYNTLDSMHNTPSSHETPTTLDIKGYKYNYSRAPRTVSPDNEPGTEGLGKVVSNNVKTTDSSTYTPEQKVLSEHGMKTAKRAPDYIGFLE